MLNITLIEDDAINLDMMTAMLEISGYQVRAIRNGSDALECLPTEHPAAFIVDLYLPFVNGLELITTIRRTPGIENTPIIAVTADGRAETQMQAFEAGCDHFLVKPFMRADLLKMVHSCLD